MVVSSRTFENVNVKSIRRDTTPEAMRSSGTVGAGKDAFRTDSQISGSRGIERRRLIKAGATWTSAGDGGGGLDGNAPARTTMTWGKETRKKGADALNWRAAALDWRVDVARGGGVRSSTAVVGVRGRGGLEGSIGNWDQFAANEMIFGVKASFDEDLYTTKLDLSSIDASRHADAERDKHEQRKRGRLRQREAERRAHERRRARGGDHDG